MTSPIERILFTDTKPEGSLMAGETAMGHYTMLAEPATPVVAIDKATAKRNAAIMNKEYGDIKVEVWKYSPFLQPTGDFILIYHIVILFMVISANHYLPLAYSP